MKDKRSLRPNNEEKLGIPMSEEIFIRMGKNPIYETMKNIGLAPREVEYQVYQAVSKSFAEWFDELYLFSGKKADIQFINYGDTELVYVLKYGGEKFTMLIGQPQTPMGQIKQEAELLQKYAKNDSKSVVAPLRYFVAASPFLDEEKDYFRQFKKEAFITSYHNQARCIASDKHLGYGIYVPEPEYHFEPFTHEESEIVCACMVAKLVMLYDQKTKSGISACKLGGGDFILDKEWDREHINATNTLQNMKLTAARQEIKCSLEEYITILRRELGQRTYYSNEEERDQNIIVNHKNRSGMTSSAIEKGIAVGLSLRNTKSKTTKKSWLPNPTPTKK